MEKRKGAVCRGWYHLCNGYLMGDGFTYCV
uniref:Uncharacterized protein n=1 Tax=Arundo donax TaxID=35708 RepID=A0A0A9GZS7_ARUDO